MDATAYTVVAPLEDGSELQSPELRQILQRADDETKLETLRRIIIATLNGSPQPNLLMPIIQYVLPSKNKQLKKMLHFYWEVCPKYDEQGKLKQEMILVVNAIRNDLVRWTLRCRRSVHCHLREIRRCLLNHFLSPPFITTATPERIHPWLDASLPAKN